MGISFPLTEFLMEEKAVRGARVRFVSAWKNGKSSKSSLIYKTFAPVIIQKKIKDYMTYAVRMFYW